MAIDASLAAAGLGLASAITWGAGDFSGGLATRRSSVFGVVAMSQGLGLVLLTLLALLTGETFPSTTALAWGGLAGLAGGVGVALLYRALAIGQMGVAAPVTAMLAAALPVLFGLLTQGAPTALQLAGFAVAIVGIWFLARPDKSVGRPEGVGLAVFSGLAIGAFLILLSQAGKEALLWPLVAARVSSFSVMFVLAVAGRSSFRPNRGLMGIILLAGVLDAAGNTFFVMATQVGRLDVSAVISSLYPASTIILARLVLGERTTRAHAMGIAAALVAIVLIAVT